MRTYTLQEVFCASGILPLHTSLRDVVVLERENYKLMSRLLEGRVRRGEYDCFADPHK